jgi:integrase
MRRNPVSIPASLHGIVYEPLCGTSESSFDAMLSSSMNRCRRWPGWLLYGITMRMFVSRLHKINLTITKGGKERTLFVPSFLLDETHHYIRYVRRRVVLESRRRDASFASAALWLGQCGTRVSTSAIRSEFRRGLENVRLTQGRFHDLRHTYAITMLDNPMKDSPDPKSRARTIESAQEASWS